MLGIFNGTQVVSAVASAGLANFLAAVLTIFGASVVAYLVMDYFHNKHIENLAKQVTDTTTITVQSIQNMITVAITAKQGMDITDKVITTPGPSAEKKAQ
jgi:heme/copper-type cytochrome/quinol oxidase subunit 3